VTPALFLFIISFICAMLCSIFIYATCYWLSEHKVEVNYLLISWNMFKYLQLYKQLTKRDYGKAGSLYYLSYIFFLLTFVSFIGAIVAKIIAL